MSTQTILIKPLPLGLKLMIAWFVLNPALFPLLYWGLPDFGISKSVDIVIAILGTIISWAVAFLLLQRKNWFRRIMVILLCVGLIVNIPTLGILLFFERDYNLLFSVLLVALNIVFIWYLSRRNIKILFLEGTGVDINDNVALNFKLELDKWSWGAFFLTWIWGLGNRVYIALLVFVPGVNIIMLGVLGMNGNAWAWRARQWDNIEQFKRSQRKWAIAGLILWLIPLTLITVSFAMWRADFNSIRRGIYNDFSSNQENVDFVVDSAPENIQPSTQETVQESTPVLADTAGFKSLGADLFTDGSNIWYFDPGNGERIKLESVEASSFQLLSATYPVVFKDRQLVWIFTGNDLFEMSGMDLRTFKKAFANVGTVYKDSLFVYVLSYNKQNNPAGDAVRFVTIEGADPSTIELIGGNPNQADGTMPVLKDKDNQYKFDKQTFEYKKVE